MRNLIRVLVVAAAFLSITSAHAAVTPLGVSVLSPVQFPPESFSVVGARVSLFWGDHRDVYGIDLGAIGNMTDNNFVGIGVSGVFNMNKGMTTVVGLQAAGITNINENKAHIVGLQVAGILNSNQAESSLVGFELALGNYSPYTTVWGAQLGIYNRAQVVNGFQIGLVNVAQSLHGIQIGLVNFNQTGLFSVAPILNIGF
jgi:hypothetical protein